MNGVIGKNLRRIRRQREMTLAAVSHFLRSAGYTPSSIATINGWELGHRNVPDGALRVLAEALGCRQADLREVRK